jgi:glycosidase
MRCVTALIPLLLTPMAVWSGVIGEPDPFPPGNQELRCEIFDRRRDVHAGRSILVFTAPFQSVSTTDEMGRFLREGVASGDYQFTVLRTGYRPLTVTLEATGHGLFHIGRSSAPLMYSAFGPCRAVETEPQAREYFSFHWNAHSPRRKVPEGEVTAVEVFGDFNRWQSGLALSDPEGDGVWSGTFEVPPTVVESDYLFNVTVSGETHSVPDPDGDDATETIAADSHFRVWPIDEPLMVIDWIHVGSLLLPLPQRMGFRFIPPHTLASDVECTGLPRELELIINGESQTIDLDDVYSVGLAYKRDCRWFDLPELPQGEVSLTLRGRTWDGRWCQDSVTVRTDWDRFPRSLPVDSASDEFRVTVVMPPMVEGHDGSDILLDPTPSSVPDPPDWLADAIVYHVFVRSFADSDGDGIGDFNGLAENLDHITDMGFNTLLLMPVWDGPSEHGYTPRSLWRVEEDYGTDEDFRRLVEACHARGVRVLLDYNDTTTYTGHPLFGEAVRDPASPFRDWIYWIDDDTYQAYTLGEDVYNGAWPQFDYSHPEVRRYMIDMLDHWVTEFGVDGFRFDSADRLQPPESWDWWTVLRREIKSRHPNIALLGEIYSDDRRWFENRLDFGYDGWFNAALTEAAAHGASVEEFARTVEWNMEVDPSGASHLRFLSNHDIDRWMTRVGGDLDRAQLGLAALLILPGVPAVYYGCEFGMEGEGIWGPNENRRFMEWRSGDQGMHLFLQTLGPLRASEPALRNGGTCEFLPTDHPEAIVQVLRCSLAEPRTDDFVLIFNFSDTPHDLPALPEGEWEGVWGPEVAGQSLPPTSFYIFRGRAE